MMNSTSVTVDISGIERKLSGGNLSAAQDFLAERILNDCEEFVPMDTGSLRGTAYLGGGGTVVYPEEYASDVYGHDRNWRTPGTTGHWLEAAEAAHMADWEADVLSKLGL